jgi:hypothetical protein
VSAQFFSVSCFVGFGILQMFSPSVSSSTPLHCPFSLLLHCLSTWKKQTRRRMARERRGAGSSLVSMETQFYKQYMKDVL